MVSGAEKMTHTSSTVAGDYLLGVSYRREEGEHPGGFAGVFGRIAKDYFQAFGDQAEALATIAAKNHHNGVDNTYAQMRRDFGLDFCRNISEKGPLLRVPSSAHLLAHIR